MSATTITSVQAPMLRQYQRDIVEQLKQLRHQQSRFLVVMPTGSGKTVLAAAIISARVERGKRVLFVAHRRELITQASRKLDDVGIDHGILMADHPRHRPDSPVQVGSIQTLIRRKDTLPDFDTVFIDECHHAAAKSYRDVVKKFPHAVVVGLTATPVRGDGAGLGDLFDAIVEGPSISMLTDQGFLVPCRVFAPTQPDLFNVKIVRGDYDERQLSQAMDQKPLIGDIVSHWHKLAFGRQSIVFASSVKHSEHIRDCFNVAGIPASHIDATTPLVERDAALADLAEGRIKVLSNCGILLEGWDCPSVSCCILARPTASLGLYLQMAGRVLRPFHGKTDARVLDHSGAALRHGLPGDPREWKLHAKKAKVSSTFSPLATICPGCHEALSLRDKVCPCGWVKPIPKPKPMIEHKPGKLTEFKGTAHEPEIKSSPWHREHRRLLQVAKEKGFKPGWAWYQMQKWVPPEESFPDDIDLF
ncbi:MAG: DEAD/DEAH box helicase [Magnetococcales bacterium]|nr:DEAD/DEAH box helicase [Magnetococcales bacterium]